MDDYAPDRYSPQFADDFTAEAFGSIAWWLANWGFREAHQQPEWERVPEDIRPTLGLYCDTLQGRLAAGDGLMIGGPVGTGKTSILAWIARQAHALDTGMSVTFLRAPTLFDHLHDGEAEAYTEQLLMIDDLGTEFRSPNSMAPGRFNELIDDRWARGLSTIVTTNLSREVLRSIPEYERALDRLEERNVWLWIAGKSQRGKARAGDWRATE